MGWDRSFPAAFKLLASAACVCGLYGVALAAARFVEHWRQGANLAQSALDAFWPLKLWLTSTLGAAMALKLRWWNAAMMLAILPLVTLAFR
jgi:hypothetical protein